MLAFVLGGFLAERAVRIDTAGNDEHLHRCSGSRSRRFPLVMSTHAKPLNTS